MRLKAPREGSVTVNDAVQIMGGESYMTENEVERIFRDSRINLIVEGANEVMQKFVFGYGGKQLAEQMLTIRSKLTWDGEQGLGGNIGRIAKNMTNGQLLAKAVPLALELFMGIKPAPPRITRLHPLLSRHGERVALLTRDLSHSFKAMSKKHEEAILNRDCVQARVADNAMWIHAMSCVLSKLDRDIRQHNGAEGDAEFKRDRTAAEHFLDLAELAIRENMRALTENADESMLKAADAALAHNDTLPNAQFVIPERSPTAKGTGRKPTQEGVKQFPGEGWRAETADHTADAGAGSRH